MKLNARPILASLALAAQLSEVAARASTTCSEQWFQGDSSSPVSTTRCQVRNLDERGSYFAVLDGKSYFHVTVVESFSTSSILGRRDVLNTREHRNFWPLSGAVQLDKLRTWRRAGRTAPRYATDGARIFYEWLAIKGADPASFEVLNEQMNADKHNDDASNDEALWSRDKSRLYFKGRPVDRARPDDVRRVGEKLIASNGHVFQIDFDRIKLRTDIDASLSHLNWAYSIDKKNVYFLGRVIQGADPGSFEAMKPECPVPGHPDLHCDPPGKFDEDRRKEGFSSTSSPQSAGTFYWWGKDKRCVYKNDECFKYDEDGREKVLSAKDARFFLLPHGTSSYFNPATRNYEIFPVSEVYIINRTHLFHRRFGVVTNQTSLRYEGALSGPFDNSYLRDKQGRISASGLERND